MNFAKFRSSRWRCSVKKAVLKNVAIFTAIDLCWSLFLIKSQAWDFIEKRLQHRCFPVNIAKFLRTPILKNICERLLLEIFQNTYFVEQLWTAASDWLLISYRQLPANPFQIMEPALWTEIKQCYEKSFTGLYRRNLVWNNEGNFAVLGCCAAAD